MVILFLWIFIVFLYLFRSHLHRKFKSLELLTEIKILKIYNLVVIEEHERSTIIEDQSKHIKKISKYLDKIYGFDVIFNEQNNVRKTLEVIQTSEFM